MAESGRDRTRRWRERLLAKRVTPSHVTSRRHSDDNGFLFAGSSGEPAANERFREFWDAYPRKVAKVAAERAWKRAAVSGVRTEEILYGLRAHLPSLLQTELRYRPHASTWLNQQRWADAVEIIPKPETASERRRREWADD